ncbi:MAG: aldehyde dehydrogenase family protein, partial [Chlorobi bacterium]|nr:aldehyde dehydrogenase family protein [Chlorobiota bacterium]
AKRFIVVEHVCTQFEEMLCQQLQRYQPGDPFDDSTVLGPLARGDLAESLARQVYGSIDRGARVLLEGGPTGRGAFFRPIVLTHVAPGMPAFDEETFGPVAAIIPARDEDEALALANRSVYGLGAAIFTRDLDRAEQCARQLDVGSVFVNLQVRSDPRLPFGGVKDSGWGRELSPFGMREFVNVKTVVVA